MKYPKQWEFLKNKFESNQLSHAYLFCGQDVAHLKTFSKEFITFINNGESGHYATAIENENFPDLLVIKSANSESSLKNERDMLEIDVDQIRQVNNFLSLTSYYGGYKTVIIEDADRMNTEAQNCFLKTLEEPKGKTLIFLITSKPDTLLNTIFSRCQTISFSHTAKEIPQQNSPLLQELIKMIGLELAEKFQFTKKLNLEGENGQQLLKGLQIYFREALLAKINISGKKLPAQVTHYTVKKIQDIIELIETLHLAISRTNANPKIALEVLLLEL